MKRAELHWSQGQISFAMISKKTVCIAVQKRLSYLEIITNKLQGIKSLSWYYESSGWLPHKKHQLKLMPWNLLLGCLY